jgi:hypothetical protein
LDRENGVGAPAVKPLAEVTQLVVKKKRGQASKISSFPRMAQVPNKPSSISGIRKMLNTTWRWGRLHEVKILIISQLRAYN